MENDSTEGDARTRRGTRLFDRAIVGDDVLDFIINILESSTEYSIIGKDLEGRIVLWNEGARRIYGYEPEEVLGKVNAETLHSPAEVAAGRPRQVLDAALRDGKWDGHLERRRKNGELFTARVVVTPRRDARGEPTGFLLISKDISDELRSGRDLKLARQSLAGLVDSAMDAIVTVDEAQRITLLNPAAERMFGYEEAEILGQSLDRLVPERFRTTHAAHVRAFGTTDVTSRRMGALRAVSGVRKGGEEFPLEASISQYETDGRKYFTAILRDITSRLRAQEALRELNADLERRVTERTAQLEIANRELEAFDYSISHDLRAPINRIGGFAAILLEEFGESLGERGREMVLRISASRQAMDQLVGDLLELSTATRGELRRADVDVSGVALRIVEGLRKAEPGRNIAVAVQLGITARADPGLLRVVLENLIGNAWKFTSPRPRASIEVVEVATAAAPAICVRDNGVGFDPAQAERLFVPFQRLHSQQDFPGTGIGLATVQRIVRRHGGRVWAESSGYGAAFYFTLIE